MKIALASGLVLLASIVALGWIALRGVGAAASFALERTRPAVTEAIAALPDGMAPADLEERIDRALAAIQAGRVDGGALRETLVWLPAALLDGNLDAGEVAALAAKLDRVLGSAAPPPADASG